LKVEGLDMWMTKVGGGAKDLDKQDVIHFTTVSVPDLLAAGFSIDKPEETEGELAAASGSSLLQSKLYHILHEARFFSERAQRNRLEPPIQVSLRVDPAALFPVELCIAKMQLCERGKMKSVWTASPPSIGSFAAVGSSSAPMQLSGSTQQLQIIVANPYLKAVQHD
jgi:hypothetical protein